MDIRLVYYEKYKGTVTSEFHYIPSEQSNLP